MAGLYDGKISRIVEAGSALKSLESNKPGVYPNPASKTLHIEAIDQDLKSIRIFDISGIVVLEDQLNQ